MGERGSGTIYARGDSLWVYVYSGGDKRVSVAKASGTLPGQTTWADAIKVLKELNARKIFARKSGSILLSPKQERATVAELAADYITQRIAQGVKRPRAFRLAIERVVKIWGPLRASKLTTEELWRDVEGLLARNYKRSTVKSWLAHLHAILNAASDRLPRMPKMPVISVPLLPKQPWTADELERLCAGAKPWLADIARFGFLTGWRISEVLQLSWDRVDLERGLLFLDETKSDDPRVRPCEPAMLDLLRGRLSGRRLGCALVFHIDGLRIRNERFYTAWQQALERAGLGWRRFHSLRSHAYDALLLKGVNLLDAMDLVGHKSLGSARRYARPSVQRMRAALEQRDKLPHSGGLNR